MLKHITIGLLIPYIVFLLYYLKNKGKVSNQIFIKLPVILLLCPIWSFIPAIVSKLPVGIVRSVICNFYVSNIFFFYGVLNKINRTGAVAGLGLIFIIFFSLVLIYARYLIVQEKQLRILEKEAK